MFVATLVAVWVATPLQGPRWEVVRAASRFDALLVEPAPGAPPAVRHRAVQLAVLVRYLQREAVELWYRGLEGDHAELDPIAALNMMQCCRDIGVAAQALGYPAGILESYWPQARLLDGLAPVCIEMRDNPKLPWTRQLPAQLEATREMLRTTFRSVLQLMN